MEDGAPRSSTRPAAVALWATAIAVLLACLAAATGTWYETSDDVGMNAGVAGGYGIAAPDEHLIFTNVLVGLALKAAYIAAPRVPWYGLYLILTLACSAAAFLWALKGLLPSWTGRLLLTAFLLGTMTTTVAALQFTRVGLIAAGAGWALVAAAIAGQAARGPAILCGLFLVFLGSLIRFNSAYLATLLAAPLLLVVALRALGSGWGFLLRVATAIALLGIVCVGARSFNRAYYRSDAGWERFFAFQERRMMFIDLGRIDENRVPPDVLSHVGWSRNDLGLMQDWFGLNPDVFSLEKQDYIIEQAAHQREILSDASINNLRPMSRSPLVWLFLAIALACVARTASLLNIGAVGLTVALFAAAMGTLAVTWHLPPRLFESAASLPAMAALGLLAWRGPSGDATTSRTGERISSLATAAALVLVLINLNATWTTAKARSDDHEQMVGNVRRLNPDPSALYVTWAEDFRHQDLVTPLGGFSNTGALHVFGVGWSNHAPVQDEGLRRAGIEDPYVALWKRPNTFLVATPERCQRLIEFIAVHYGQILTCTVTDQSLSVLALTPVSVHGPSIGVRWSERVSDADRARLEERYGLQRPRSKGSRTWRYELTDSSPDRVRRLVADTAVDDTSGINRETGEIVSPEPDW